MSLFENLTKKVTETAKVAAKKSGDLVEVTKLNMNIGTEESKIEKVYTDIGKIVFEAYNKGEETSECFKEHCEKIKASQEIIKQMKEKINELKNVKLCSACGTELAAETAFCSKCGAKQEIPQPPAPEPTDKKCSACGEVNALDAVFCAKCGAKFE